VASAATIRRCVGGVIWRSRAAKLNGAAATVLPVALGPGCEPVLGRATHARPGRAASARVDLAQTPASPWPELGPGDAGPARWVGVPVAARRCWEADHRV